MIQKVQNHPSGPRTVALLAGRFTSNSLEPLHDAEFGPVSLKRHAKARAVKLRMQSSGELVVTLPLFASERHARELIDTSRVTIRQWRAHHSRAQKVYTDGDTVGHSHSIKILRHDEPSITVKQTGLRIVATLPHDQEETAEKVQLALRPAIAKALQKEARAYLPRRLAYLADKYGFSYQKVRFGTQKGRWGSCSTQGTISLNVGLMELDVDLIDYVLIHELCHTKQMNHSTRFWELVTSYMPDYEVRRKALKNVQPHSNE